ncbi:MAG: YIP1 family protein [Vulcanimicrobiota bacterium]
MIKKPATFFKDIAGQNFSLVIPIVILIITGVLMGIIVFYNIPQIKETWEETNLDNDYTINQLIKAKKVQAFLAPLWTIFFWILFSSGLLIVILGFSGKAEFKEIFNSTSFLAFPLLAQQILRVFMTALPNLGGVYTVVSILFFGYLCFLVFIISREVGLLNNIQAGFATAISVFFGTLLWYVYDPLISMLIIGHEF